MIPVDTIRFGIASDLNWPEATFLIVLAILGAFVGWIVAASRSKNRFCTARPDGMPLDREHFLKKVNQAYTDGYIDGYATASARAIVAPMAQLSRAEEVLSLLRCAAKDWDYTGGSQIEAKGLFSALARYDAEQAIATPFFNLASHLKRQREFSIRTFGPGPRTTGLIKHLGDELLEVEKNPGEVEEWIDIVILGFDGALRNCGCTPEMVVHALAAKQAKNEARTWPDWRAQPAGEPIHHVEVTAK